MPWLGGPWVRVSPAQPARPELVDLSGGTWVPSTGRRRQAQATVRILCPAEKEPVPVEDEPAGVPETGAQRRARQAAQAAAGWT